MYHPPACVVLRVKFVGWKGPVPCYSQFSRGRLPKWIGLKGIVLRLGGDPNQQSQGPTEQREIITVSDDTVLGETLLRTNPFITRNTCFILLEILDCALQSKVHQLIGTMQRMQRYSMPLATKSHSAREARKQRFCLRPTNSMVPALISPRSTALAVFKPMQSISSPQNEWNEAITLLCGLYLTTTTVSCKDQEPRVFQEMMQPAEARRIIKSLKSLFCCTRQTDPRPHPPTILRPFHLRTALDGDGHSPEIVPL